MRCLYKTVLKENYATLLHALIFKCFTYCRSPNKVILSYAVIHLQGASAVKQKFVFEVLKTDLSTSASEEMELMYFSPFIPLSTTKTPGDYI